MKVALVYPPTCDPTAPYLSLPTLAGYLRTHGVDVVLIDANVEVYDRLLRREPLARLAERVERRWWRLERRPALSHVEQLAYVALADARADAAAVPGRIDTAVALLRGERGREAFFDADAYADATDTVDGALRLIAAAHAPLVLDFVRYRTPFSLLSAAEIEADAEPTRNPFHEYFAGELCERLRRERVDVVGISVVFPGQLQPAYSLAYVLRKALPQTHLCVGGPAITQLLTRLSGDALERARGPFHAALLFEGEALLLEHVQALERGEPREGVYRGRQQDMAALPAPDFTGLPLDKYFSPELVLPYDPTRGCYWGACTFCHYGLAEVGTAAYRERPVAAALEHLRGLAARHACRLFYFSQDSVSPKTALKLARAIREAELPWRWATDMRPERSLTPERCAELAAGGAIAMALGVESAAPRVLALIDKGVPVETVGRAIENLAGAGLAVEAMCFTDFPSETLREALATLEFLEERRGDVALFICGEFDLTHGSLVAQRPRDFGIHETWQIEGDELGTGLFYEEVRRSKSGPEREQVDAALARLSRRWRLSHYPWAGALSTAHTLLWYERHGPDVFKRLAAAPRPARRVRSGPPLRYDLGALRSRALAAEAEIWHALVREERRVSRAAYRAHAAALPSVHPRGRPRPQPTRPDARPGRRVRHSANAAQQTGRG